MPAATILAQAPTPDATTGALEALLDAIDRHGVQEATVVRCAGPYDVIATVEADPDTLGRIAVTAQAAPAIARTLTLPHV